MPSEHTSPRRSSDLSSQDVGQARPSEQGAVPHPMRPIRANARRTPANCDLPIFSFFPESVRGGRYHALEPLGGGKLKPTRTTSHLRRTASYSGCALLMLSVALSGCGPTTPEEEGPSITTEELPPAYLGAAYSEQLSSDGGTPPLEWSLVSRADSLQWVTLSPKGKMGGTPTEVVLPPARITVEVMDAEGHLASREILLEVRACDDGVVRDCGIADGNSCLLGAQRWEGGRFSSCTGGAPSADLENCGPGCEGCGEGGDECV